MMNRKLSFALLWVGLTSLTGCEQEISRYEASWEHRAHSLQRELDANVPLTRSTFMGTHNSYNASSYTTPQSYPDPNQTHSITSQLRMDIRALELDVHSFNVYDQATGTWSIDLLLCHGLGNHLGCSPWDRPFVAGLQEIADWISKPENRDEVLLVYIEDHINSTHYHMALNAIEKTIAPFVYKPENFGFSKVPSSMSKQQVRDAGKNILLITDGCQNSYFSQYVFAGFENGPSGYPTAGVEDLLPAPDCLSQSYPEENIDALFVRIQEDRTVLSNLVGAAGPRITPELVTNLVNCEINLIGLDKLRPFDGRLRAGIWSWAVNEPASAPEKNCAVHNGSSRFEAAACDTPLPFACRDHHGGGWFITAHKGGWAEGFSACEEADMAFSVPFSAKDNADLSYWKDVVDISDVWLGYSNGETGEWQAYY
ncbi:MAG: hypothetical protein R3208_08450 [Ketobacteraceae bacterium]|nr:hypothetical protein [Ketobacteraceae bacterium]